MEKLRYSVTSPLQNALITELMMLRSIPRAQRRSLGGFICSPTDEMVLTGRKRGSKDKRGKEEIIKRVAREIEVNVSPDPCHTDCVLS